MMSIHLFIKKSVFCVFFSSPPPKKAPKKKTKKMKKKKKTQNSIHPQPSDHQTTPKPPPQTPPWSPMPPNDLTPPRHRCLPHGLVLSNPTKVPTNLARCLFHPSWNPRFLEKKTPGKTWENYITCPPERNFRGINGNKPPFNRKKLRRRRLPKNTMFFWWHVFVEMYS